MNNSSRERSGHSSSVVSFNCLYDAVELEPMVLRTFGVPPIKEVPDETELPTPGGRASMRPSRASGMFAASKTQPSEFDPAHSTKRAKFKQKEACEVCQVGSCAVM